MIKKLINAVLAGVSISLGAVIYLLCSNKIVGAFMFSIGIILVMEFKFALFTGYVPTKRKGQGFGEYVLNSLFVFIGNLLGAGITAGLLALTKKREVLYNACTELCDTKLSDNLLSVFILSIFCGIIIAGIVKATNYKKQVIYIGLMIATFILCGYEHVVANSFYFAMSLRLFTWNGLLFMLICLLGNFVGGLACSFIPHPMDEPVVPEEPKEEE